MENRVNVRIALHSDLHTEVSLCTLSGLAEADLLILAGDIGDNQTLPLFFEWLRREAPNLPTLYVMGNHEFYGHEFHQAKALYHEICADYDVRMLDNEAVWFDDVLIAGSVLWSDFELANDRLQSMQWAQNVLPDFEFIRYGDGMFTVEHMLREHQRSIAFLRQVLTKDAAHKLVISHFLPSHLLVDKKHAKNQAGLIRSAYWTSDLPELYSHADTWVYGHSHSNIITQALGCRFISNQRGYRQHINGHENNGYQRHYTFDLESR